MTETEQTSEASTLYYDDTESEETENDSEIEFDDESR